MSTTVDQRVVEMEFNNSNFESNVKTSMSTIEKLKNALDFSGACGGLEDLNSSIGNVDMGVLGNAVGSVSKSFSALEVVAITALVNITNQAISAGEQLVSSLTVDQVTAGWEKFSENTKNIGTLVAQGFDLSTVEEQLDKLLWYTDETSYNYSDMVTTISKFTASGMGLEDSVTAMMGIANAAALSGQNATTASSSMYQLAQAMSVGYIKLSDWQQAFSNKNMDTTTLRQQCLDAATALGTLTEVSEGVYETLEGNTVTLTDFTSNLTSDAWLTADVMMEVFENYANAVDAIYEYTEETGCTASEAIEELADSLDDFGVTAFEAAQQARTFEDVVDSVKDAASTAWLTIFNSIFGDYEETVERWTALANKLYYMFVQPIYDWWESFDNALSNSPLGSFIDTITELTSSTSEAAATVEEVASAIEDVGDVVNAVIRGEWGNGQTRWDALTEAGYDWAYVQNLVNEQLGNSVRHETSYTEATADATAATEDAAEAVAYTADQLAALSDAELTELGLEEDEIKSLRTYAAAAEAAGMSLADFLDSMSDMTGREMLWAGLQNAATAVLEVFNAIGEAWSEVFPPASSDQISNAIKAFYSWSLTLKDNNAALAKITRTFKGLFSILKIIKKTISTLISGVLYVLSSVLGGIQLDVLGMTASVGDAIVAFEEWFIESGLLASIIQNVADKIIYGITVVKNYVKAFLELPKVQTAITFVKSKLEELLEAGVNAVAGLKQAFTDGTLFANIKAMSDRILACVDAVKQYIAAFAKLPKVQSALKIVKNKLEEIKEVATNVIEGLKEGLEDGSMTIFEVVTYIGAGIIEAIKTVLGIHSPSTEMYEVGTNTVEGLVNGLLDSSDSVSSVVDKIGEMIIDGISEISSSAGKMVSSIDFGSAISLAGAALMLWFAKSLVNTFKSLVTPVQSLIEVMGNSITSVTTALSKIGTLITSAVESVGAISKYLKAQAFEKRADGILKLAEAVAILAGVVFVLATFAEPEKLWEAVKIIGALALVVAVLAFAVSKISGSAVSLTKQGFVIGSIVPTLLSIGFAVLALAAALFIVVGTAKLAGTLDTAAIEHAMEFMLAFGVLLGLLIKTSSLYSDAGIFKFGAAAFALAVALLIVVLVAKLAGTLDEDAIVNGVGFMAVFGAFLNVIIQTASMYPVNSLIQVGGIALALAVALLIVVIAAKLAGTLDEDAIVKGLAFMAAFGVFLNLMIKTMSMYPIGTVIQVGGTILAFAAALLILIIAAKLAEFLTIEGIAKAFICSVMVLAIIVVLAKITDTYGNKMIKVGVSLLLVAVAIALLAGIAIVLSIFPEEGLQKGITAVGWLSIFIAVLLAATGKAGECKSTLVMIVVVIAVLVAAIAVLSFIETDKLYAATFALSLLMAMFAAICASSKLVTDSWATLLVIVVVVALLAGILIALSLFDTEAMLQASEAMVLMAAVFVAVAAAGALLASATTWGAGAAAGIAIIAGLVTEMIALMAIIGLLVEETGAISHIESACDAMLAVGTAIGNFIGGIIGGIAEGIASALPSIGTSLSDFADNASGFIDAMSEIDDDIVDNAVKLAEAILAITAGGVVSSILSVFGGGSSLTEFSASMVALGQGLHVFYDETKDIDGTAVSKSAEAVSALVEVANAIPNSGGLLGMIAGNNDLDDFGEMIKSLGTSLASYYNEASEIKEKPFNVGADAVKQFGKALDYLPDNVSNLTEFGTALRAFAPALNEYCEAISEIDYEKLDANIETFYDSINMLSELSSVAETSIDKFRTALEDLGEKGVSSFITGLENGTGDVLNAIEGLLKSATDNMDGKASVFQSSATNLMDGFISGLTTRKMTMLNSLNVVMNWAVNAVDSYYDSFYAKGKFMVQGFAKGIENNKSLAESAAKKVANAAVTAANKALDINSPSKVAYQIGDYFGIGFVNAIADSAEDAADASSDMANAASTGLSNALSGITDLLDSDMDTQPTIRPVLDLSNIETGMTTLSTMFGAEQAISASVGVDRVRNQNAENASLTSSMMDKLAKLSTNSTGETFTFNNTFEVNGGGDAKEIAEQVSTIIQRQINRKGAAWR